MNQRREPNIRIRVDSTNPGQFFACCGLLELADRLWGEAEGCFHNHHFLLFSTGTLRELIEKLRDSNTTIFENEGEPSIHPIRLDSFNLKLNWWLREDWSRFKNSPKNKRVGLMKTKLKFWAGNQSAPQLVENLQQAAEIPRKEKEEMYFSQRAILSSRFGLDAGPAWTALDVGFSLNEHPQIGVKASAAVELLAAVGLQRCRPNIFEEFIDYATWLDPMTPSVLPAIVSGIIDADTGTMFRTEIIERGSYAAFSYSRIISRGHYE